MTARAVLPRLTFALISALLLTGIVLSAAAPSADAAPVRASWTWVKKGKIAGNVGSLDEVQCPSTKLCVAGGGQAVWTTTTPGGLARAWKKVNISQNHPTLGRSYIFELSCPTDTFCVAGDDHSNVMTTTNPTGGAGAWVPRSLPSGTYVGVRGLSCASPMLCAVTDVSGYAMTSVNPLGGIYRATQLSTVLNAGLYDLSCAGTICVSVQDDGFLWATADARVQPAVWTKVRLGVGRNGLNAVACGSPQLCIAAGDGSTIRVSTNPAGGAATWKKVAVPGSLHIDHATCKTASLCFLTAGTKVYWSTRPAVAGSWKLSSDRTRSVILSDISCPTVRQCVLIDVGSNVWVGTR